MAAAIGLLVGMLIGGVAIGGGAGALLGGVVGAFAGFLIAAGRERGRHLRPEHGASAAHPTVASASEMPLAQRVIALERRVADLEGALRVRAAPSGPMASAPAPLAAAPESEFAATPAPLPIPATADASERGVPATAAPPNADGTLPASAPAAMVGAVPPMAVLATRPTPFIPAPPAPPNPVWAWIAGGNTLARIGVILLFIGVGFLLKYAVEHVHVPISLRLAGIALGGVALLVIGWRLRVKRRAYAMVLQGGGVGVLYLTVFAALRLYGLVPPAAAFGLLVFISAVSSWLAVRQDAISLAALAVAGGFLAPILTSSQTGNHVMLFSYYALLNAGILGIAWFKAWRSLNLLGFAFTFLVGTFWGVTRYRPENFATTEPFLVVFFLFYVAIAVLYALRRSVEVRDYVDAGIVFGTPLVAAGLQSALVRDIEYGMAGSALAMSALYLVLARFLWTRRRDDLRLLVESFLALGVVFATLAIPLALDARWTAAAWAVEGAAIVWVGVRQQRPLVRVCGLLLELGAGIAFLLGLSLWAPPSPAAPIPIANSAFVGAVLVALAALFSAWRLQRPADGARDADGSFAAAAFAWGTLWWLYAGWREIDRFVAYDMRVAALVALLAATAIAFAALERALRWPTARVPALVLLPALLAVAAVAIARAWPQSDHLFAHGGALAWPFAVATVIGLLRWFDRPGAGTAGGAPPALEPWHAGAFWLVLLVAAHELAWAGSRIAYGHGVWTAVPWGLVPALGIGAVCALASGSSWPFAAHRRGYLVLGAAPVAALLALWSVAANVHGDGDPAPLPYLPLANPLDIAQAIVLVALATWTVRGGREEPGLFDALPAGAAAAALCALAFLWVNAIALRVIHFYYDVPYTPPALWHSTLVQAVLSILWSTLALATMALANRRQWRTPWLAGAALLGVVVVKLFAVELAQVGTITQIVSFIGVGLLLLLIGYLAPVPPRRREDAP